MAKRGNCRCCWRPQVPTEPLCRDCYNLTRDIAQHLQPLYRQFPQYRSLPLDQLVKRMVEKFLAMGPR